jgi:hypothetical protein
MTINPSPIKWSKLTKKDRNHLREMKITGYASMKYQVEHMKKQIAISHDITNGGHAYACHDCEHIAYQLGLWDYDWNTRKVE